MFILLDDAPFEIPYKGGVVLHLRPIRNDEKSKILRASFVDREGGNGTHTDFRLYMVKTMEAGLVGWSGLKAMRRTAEGKVERVDMPHTPENLKLVVNKMDEDDFQAILGLINSPGAAIAKQTEELGKD